ncbi:MAG: hypothetical protein ACRD04_03960 [Terriglobales bacterium]
MAKRSWLGMSSAGALLSSGGVLATWACCSLPLAAGALGVGVGAMGVAMSPWRPYLVGLSVLLAGLALAAAYRPLPRRGEGAACALKPRRSRLLWAWALVAITIFIAALPLWETLWLGL